MSATRVEKPGGNLIIANGGVPRSLADKKFDLHRMDSSLVKLDSRNGSWMIRA